MAYVSLTTLKFWIDCGILYFKSGLCCFESSSTLIAVSIERQFGDLFKPLLAELGAKKDILKKQEKLNKHTDKHNGPAEWCMINVIYQQVDCTINPKSREQEPK